VEGSGSWPNFKVLSLHLDGETEEGHEKSQDSRSPGQALNPGPPEDEAGVLTTRPLWSKQFAKTKHTKWSRVSSGSIVSDYGLDDWAIGVRSPAGAKHFSSNLCVQTGSEAHPASCTMGTGGPFPGGKARPGGDADHSPPSNAEVVNE
jgi:hypothetical protein